MEGEKGEVTASVAQGGWYYVEFVNDGWNTILVELSQNYDNEDADIYLR